MSTLTVTYQLPGEIIQAIEDQARITGLDHSEVVTLALQQALLIPELSQADASQVSQPASQFSQLAAVEARLTALEGKWHQVYPLLQQLDQSNVLSLLSQLDQRTLALNSANPVDLLHVLTQRLTELTQLAQTEAAPPAPKIQLVAATHTKADLPNFLPSNYVQIDHFLTQAEQQQLLAYTLANEARFVPTETSTNDLSYRRSAVIHEFPEFSQLIKQRIHSVISEVQSLLSLPQFEITQIESQLTAHNDGNYYKIHNDNGSSTTATRELTYVYYFYQEPKPFSGGELLLYDSKIENNFYVAADSTQQVEPRNNSMVFFLSRYLHEVLPVSCPSQQFGDSRFTINGWIRR